MLKNLPIFKDLKCISKINQEKKILLNFEGKISFFYKTLVKVIYIPIFFADNVFHIKKHSYNERI